MIPEQIAIATREAWICNIRFIAILESLANGCF